ncbi:38887_t:CDS:2, partial [Gigaspora margarita]
YEETLNISSTSSASSSRTTNVTSPTSKPFSSYKHLSQIETIFGISATRLNDLPKLNMHVDTMTLYDFDDQLNFTIAQIKVLYLLLNNRSDFVNVILRGIVSTFARSENITMREEYDLSGTNGNGKVDFAIVQGGHILCVIEVKNHDLENGFCQNLVQAQSACETNNGRSKKRKHEELEYVYGLVTTGEKWFLTMVTSDGRVGAASEPIYIRLSNSNISNEAIKEDLRTLFSAVITMLSDKLESIKEPKQSPVKLIEC